MKYTLLTGASTGIGKELAIIMAQKGHNLILVARTKSKLEELKNELKKYNVDIKVISQDLSEKDSSAKLYKKISKQKLELNILVNNAGFGLLKDVDDAYLKEMQQMMHLNMITPTELTKLCLPDLKKSKGKILNVASVAAFMPGPKMSIYYATKAYLSSFSIAQNEELKKQGISVSALYPGPTKTKFAQRAKAQVLFKNGTDSAEHVAKKGYEGMMNGKVKIIPSFKLKIGLALLSLIPAKYQAKLAKRIHEGK